MKSLLLTLLLLPSLEGNRLWTKIIFTLDYPQNSTYKLQIYPLNDTDFFIERIYDINNYCIEQVVYQDEIISKTRFQYGEFNKLFSYEEFFYSGGEIIETRSQFDSVYRLSPKIFKVNDSLNFEISYFKNGRIADFGLKKNFCYCSNVFNFDQLNISYWTGFYSETSKLNTTHHINQTNGENLKNEKNCSSDSVGVWRRINVIGRVIEALEIKK